MCLACSPRKGGNSDFAAARLAGAFNEAARSGPGAEVILPPPSPPFSPFPWELADLVFLRERPVAACVSCGVCDRPGLAPCSLDGRRAVSCACPAPGAGAIGNRAVGASAVGNRAVGHGAVRHCPVDPSSVDPSSVDHGPEMFDKLFSAPVLLISSPIYFYHVPALFKAFIDRGQYWWMRKLQGHPRFNGLREKRPAHVLLLCGRPKGERLFEGSLLSLKYFLSIFGFELREPLLLRGLDGPGDLAGNAELTRSVEAWAAAAAANFKP